MKWSTVVFLSMFSTFVCASERIYPLDSLWDHELESDGHVFDMTIYPVDGGSRRQYHFFFEPLSAIRARYESHPIPLGPVDLSNAITPIVPGEFDGMDGDRASG